MWYIANTEENLRVELCTGSTVAYRYMYGNPPTSTDRRVRAHLRFPHTHILIISYSHKVALDIKTKNKIGGRVYMHHCPCKFARTYHIHIISLLCTDCLQNYPYVSDKSAIFANTEANLRVELRTGSTVSRTIVWNSMLFKKQRNGYLEKKKASWHPL